VHRLQNTYLAWTCTSSSRCVHSKSTVSLPFLILLFFVVSIFSANFWRHLRLFNLLLLYSSSHGGGYAEDAFLTWLRWKDEEARERDRLQANLNLLFERMYTFPCLHSFIRSVRKPHDRTHTHIHTTLFFSHLHFSYSTFDSKDVSWKGSERATFFIEEQPEEEVGMQPDYAIARLLVAEKKKRHELKKMNATEKEHK